MRSIASYVRSIKPALPPETFRPARSRVLWLPVHALAIAGSILAITRGPWIAWPIASLVIGCSFGGLAFLAHETLHGAVVSGRSARRVIGWLGFLPFTLSPRLWCAWHNRVHHGHTNDPSRDPDLYPTLDQYEASRALRAVTRFSLGGRRWLGAGSILLGFSVQSATVLVRARGQGMLGRRALFTAIIETVLGVAVWASLLVAIGFWPFVFAYAIPLVIGNSIVMSFIVTNHGLSPLGAVNDPLSNSLTVTVPRWIDFLVLGFGWHVEHHIFPSVSARHGARIAAVLREKHPDTYQAMPLHEALLALHRTARVYRDDRTLYDPHTGHTWPTLGYDRAG